MNIRKIAELPCCKKMQSIKERVNSYPFYVIYGMGFATEFMFDNYVSHFSAPKYIIDKVKGGGAYRDIPILSSLSEIEENNYCVPQA